MRLHFLAFFLILPFFIHGQSVDTASVRVEIDSLIKKNVKLIDEQKLDEALIVIQNAEEKCLASFGEKTALYATIVSEIGIIYFYKGEYSTVEPLFLEGKAIYEKTLGKEHPDYSATLNNLAYLYEKMGEYEKAELLSLESKAIDEKALGKEHPGYAATLNNLAALYLKMGEYEKAEPLFLESKAIDEKALGKEHPGYATTLNNLAILYEKMGEYEKAKLLFLECQAIDEKALGKEHPDYAATLNNLADLYKNMGEYEKAKSLFLESKVIREKALGKEHPDYAGSLNNLANLYKNMGEYEKAKSLFLESKAIYEKALEKEHRLYAGSLNNLAHLYENMSEFEKAESLFLESKAIYEKALGMEHLDYATVLNNLAHLYENMGEYEKAEPLYVEANKIEKKLLIKSCRHLSERELFFYANKFIEKQNQFLSFVQTQEKISGSVFDNTLFYKGFLLNATQQVNRLVQTDSLSTKLFLKLKAYHRYLAKEYSKPVAKRDSSGVVDLEEKANSLEKELARAVAGFGEALRQVTWQEVQERLQPGEAAIEFIHYRFYDPDQTDSMMYAALLLRPGDEQPQFISLFEEKSLDSLFGAHKERRSDYVNDLYSFSERGLVAADKPQKTLYELIWEPLASQLGEAKTIYFSPSGLLHRLNLGAIPVCEEQSLSDQYNFVQLNSTRELVVPDQNISSTNDAILFGGVQYDMDSLSIAAVNDELVAKGVTLATRGELSFQYADPALRGASYWGYLKNTEKEITAIAEMLAELLRFNTDTLIGYSATEETFRQCGEGQISTHHPSGYSRILFP